MPAATSWRGSRLISPRATTAGRVSSSDAESERYLLFGAVVDLLARVSALAPVVLVLDDLHWADRPTIQLLRHVVSADAPLRLFVIGTFRDSDVDPDHPLAEALAALHRESGVERLALRGLGDDELLALLETTAGHAMADEGVALRDALLAETDGNPFFVGEMLRHLAETRAIYEDEQGRWVASADLRTSGLPVSIREVIGRRVARLGEPTRDVLSLAAVIGRDFDADVLARVSELDEDTLIDLCDQAVAAAVLTEADVAGRYTFAHALIEHALYDVALAGRRGRTHRRVAEALEELCGDDPAERIGELAYHWARATPPDAGKAIAYAQRAGDRALAQLAPDEALRWYRDALDLLDRASVDDPHRRAALLLGLGDAQRQTGDPAHRETLLAAGRLADDIDAVDLLVRAALRNNRGWNSVTWWGRRRTHRHAQTRARTARRPRTAPTGRACSRCCASSAPGTPISTNASRWRPEPSTSRGAQATRPRWSTRSGCATSRSRCPRPSSSASAGTPRRATSPTISATRPHACHANDNRLAGGAGGGRPRDHADRVGDLRVGIRADRTAAQPVADRRTTGAWQRMLEGDLDAAEQSATEALTLGTAAGYPDDAVTFYGAQLMCLRWMQGRQSRDDPAHRGGRARQPRRAPSSAPFSHRRGASTTLTTRCVSSSTPRSPTTSRCSPTPRGSSARCSGPTPRRAVAIDPPRWPCINACCRGTTSSRPDPSRSTGAWRTTSDCSLTPSTVTTKPSSGSARRSRSTKRWKRRSSSRLTQTAWADLLADRDQAGDAQRARALAGAALPVATERGYGYVERDARSLLERIG